MITNLSICNLMHTCLNEQSRLPDDMKIINKFIRLLYLKKISFIEILSKS